MAMELGGRADKLGNEYERLWVTKQLLLLVAEEVDSVLLEGLGLSLIHISEPTRPY